MPLDLETILSALGPGLTSFGKGLSFEQDEERQRQERDQLRRDRLNREGVEDQRYAATTAENTRRYENTQRQANAGVMADQMIPNQEIDDLTYSFLQGTPYEARVRSQNTIPTNPVRGNMALAPGGDALGAVDMPATAAAPSRTWRPTYAEGRQVEKDAALNDVLSDPSMARYGSRIRAGLGTAELPTERAAREAAGDTAATNRSLAVERARAKSVLDEIRLRDSLSDNPGGGKSAKAENLWKTYGDEYKSFVAEHANKQKQRQDEAVRLQKPDPLNPGKSTGGEVFYEEPLSFDQWLKQRKGIDPYGRSSATPVTPRASHTTTSAADQASVAAPSLAPQTGQRVTVRGQSVMVGKVYPDGSWDPAPSMAPSH